MFKTLVANLCVTALWRSTTDTTAKKKILVRIKVCETTDTIPLYYCYILFTISEILWITKYRWVFKVAFFVQIKQAQKTLFGREGKSLTLINRFIIKHLKSSGFFLFVLVCFCPTTKAYSTSTAFLIWTESKPSDYFSVEKAIWSRWCTPNWRAVLAEVEWFKNKLVLAFYLVQKKAWA